MSKRSYTEVDLGEPLKYEHRIKVNDFVRLIKRKDEIRTNLIEIFPGVRVEFVIRKFDENEKKTFTVDRDQYQYNVQSVTMSERDGRQLQKNPEDTLICLEIERKEASEKVKLAGEVRVDMAGQIETVKLGDVEKSEYKAFTDNKITINSNSGIKVTYYGQSRGYDGYQADIYGQRSGYNGSKQNSIKDTGVFLYKSGGWEDEAVTLEIVFSLQYPGLLLTSHGVKIPKTLTSQETLSAVNKAIMEDQETADLTLRCREETFRVHKNFLCSR